MDGEHGHWTLEVLSRAALGRSGARINVLSLLSRAHYSTHRLRPPFTQSQSRSWHCAQERTALRLDTGILGGRATCILYNKPIRVNVARSQCETKMLAGYSRARC